MQVGAPRVKIVSVDVDSVDSKAGESIHICVRARNATSFAVRPEQQLLSKDQRSCFADRPAQTTTYTVTATGAGGDTESEKITVKVSR